MNVKKTDLYRRMEADTPKIMLDAKKAADELGIPAELRGRIGLTGAISGRPPPLIRNVREAVHKVEVDFVPAGSLVEKLRDIIQNFYGDEFDVAPLGTCEAALWVSFDALATPPMQGRGSTYRTRVLAPYERHMHHHAAYGRPFPPKYKDLIADRGVTAGEQGLQGKRLDNMDTVIVPLIGGKYEVHGIKHYVTPLLTRVDPDASRERIKRAAQRHATMISAFTSLGYDIPGYGYGIHDEKGVPKLQQYLGKLAEEYNVPYIVDNAWGIPIVGLDPRSVGADLVLYSMDKAAFSPTSGMIVGREDVMIEIRRALGMHSNRWGTTHSYGKAAYVSMDAGKEAIAGQIAACEIFRDEPNVVTKPVDQLYSIVLEEFRPLTERFKDGFLISKTYNSGSVEVNYERTWENEEIGIPIFTIEDMYAGTSLIQEAVRNMGVSPTIAYDANIMVSPGAGTLDEEGNLIEQRMRYAVRALMRSIQIVCKYAGIEL